MAVKHEKQKKKQVSALQTARLIFCVLAAGALMLIKSFFPDTAARMGEKLGAVIEKDVDYIAAIASLNDFFFVDKDKDREEAPEEPAEKKETGLDIREDERPLAIADIETRASFLKAALEEKSVETAALPFDFCSPLAGEITSPFGERNGRFHYGVDIAAQKGAEIRSCAAGRIAVAAESVTYGNYVIIEHAGGYSSLYAHCSELKVRAGEKVAAGEIIALAGDTGNADGVHLHFELAKNGVCFDAAPYLAQSGL